MIRSPLFHLREVLGWIYHLLCKCLIVSSTLLAVPCSLSDLCTVSSIDLSPSTQGGLDKKDLALESCEKIVANQESWIEKMREVFDALQSEEV